VKTKSWALNSTPHDEAGNRGRHDGLLDSKLTGLRIEVPPGGAAQVASSRYGRRGHPHERSECRIPPFGFDENGGHSVDRWDGDLVAGRAAVVLSARVRIPTDEDT
jgi:hypothetical protein